MMKRLVSATLSMLLVLSLSACGSGSASTGNSAEPEKAPDLAGTWKQTNSGSEYSYQEAAISGDTIEINWVSDGGDTTSLYWAGSFIAPTTAEEPYTWDSENDHGKTDSALLASSDDTKTFTYQDGVISYQASALGTTTTIKLEKQ